MYVPQHFAETRVSVLHEAIGKSGIATLVTSGDGDIEASHVPMLLDPDPAPFGTLLGHIARDNPQWRTKSASALAIFLGSDTYVSPSWYETKKTNGKVVPTWNYIAIHAHGPIEWFDDAKRLRAIVTRLTEKYESGRAAPWAVSDAPEDYVQSMLKAIVGFALPIVRLDGKWKMSQNRPPADHERVASELRAEGKSDIADTVLARSRDRGRPT
jgi:transcriptional regulator